MDFFHAEKCPQDCCDFCREPTVLECLHSFDRENYFAHSFACVVGFIFGIR